MHSSTRTVFVTLLAALTGLAPIHGAEAQRTATPAYRDSTLSVDARVRDLLSRMTPEEKFWQLFMIPGDRDNPQYDYSHGIFGLQIRSPGGTHLMARQHAARIAAIQHYFVDSTRLGIPIIPFEEALHGLVADDATSFPQAIALAATWDTALVSRVADAIAQETRSRGIRDVLSPVLNVATDVRWGRTEETYGEDPMLVSRMGVAFVSAFEWRGIVATPKHFIANFGAGGRDSYPIDISRRALMETYFPPFRAAIQEGHAQSVMSAYNSVDGQPASQNPALLNGVLKRDWGLQGFIISDAAAVGGATVLHHTEANTAIATRDALDAGLDVIFQSSWPQYRSYYAAFHNGMIPDSVVDSAVARVLRVKFRLGLFEHPYGSPDSAAYWSASPAHRALARRAAQESIVLLRNQEHVLPLAPNVHSVAVIGLDAAEARLGGYSGPGIRPVSILDGIRARLGASGVVRYASGPGRLDTTYVTVPSAQLSTIDSGHTVHGLRGEYFDNNQLAGTPTIVRVDSEVDEHWTLNSPGRGIPFDWYSVRWTGTVTVPARGVRHIGIEGNDGYRIYIDGTLAVDDWIKRSYGTHTAAVDWAPGSTHDIRIEYFESTGNARVKLVWDAGVTDAWRSTISDAVDSARKSDVAIVVAGIEEGEFRDRALLSLPGHQEELIRRVAATGRPTVVVLVGGSAITMSNWLDSVSAVLDAWYPGEEGGDAVADVLFGDADPAGRLPITFPLAEGQLPLVYDHKPTGRGDDYLDLSGQPLFPFGFGLSYTTFRYSDLRVTPDTIAPSGSAEVRCKVTNIGARAGDEVVQLYVHDVLASVAQPVEKLAGFTRVHLAAGETREVTFTLSRDQLALLDRDLNSVVEPGVFRVLVGGSSRDIRLRGELVVRYARARDDEPLSVWSYIDLLNPPGEAGGNRHGEKPPATDHRDRLPDPQIGAIHGRR